MKDIIKCKGGFKIRLLYFKIRMISSGYLNHRHIIINSHYFFLRRYCNKSQKKLSTDCLNCKKQYLYLHVYWM